VEMTPWSGGVEKVTGCDMESGCGRLDVGTGENGAVEPVGVVGGKREKAGMDAVEVEVSGTKPLRRSAES
jgi:hypothetical protein